jgi:hypothetical protein
VGIGTPGRPAQYSTPVLGVVDGRFGGLSEGAGRVDGSCATGGGVRTGVDATACETGAAETGAAETGEAETEAAETDTGGGAS